MQQSNPAASSPTPSKIDLISRNDRKERKRKRKRGVESSAKERKKSRSVKPEEKAVCSFIGPMLPSSECGRTQMQNTKATEDRNRHEEWMRLDCLSDVNAEAKSRMQRAAQTENLMKPRGFSQLSRGSDRLRLDLTPEERSVCVQLVLRGSITDINRSLLPAMRHHSWSNIVPDLQRSNQLQNKEQGDCFDPERDMASLGRFGGCADTLSSRFTRGVQK